MRIGRMLVAAALAVYPTTLFAQSKPLAEILPDLLLQSVTMTSNVTVNGNPHEAHFIAALGQNKAPFDINKLLASQIGTFPTGTSSGGFVFNFDPASGLFQPASQSFGPGFTERALTNGKGRFGFGLNFQHLRFTSYEGVSLNNGSLAFVLQHNDCCAPTPGLEDPFFEGDLVKMALSLDVSTNVVQPFVSFGLTNRWDVGVSVPIVKVEINPTITSTIDRISTCSAPTACNVLIHSWDGAGATTKVTSVSASATGIGDIVLRTKYRVADTKGGGLAAALDLRLPSGDKENLLGTGAVQTKLSLVASGEISRIAPHVNVGYTFSRGGLSDSLTSLPTETQPANAPTRGQINAASGPLVNTDVPNEFNYAGGLDFAAHPLVTVSADVIGRSILNINRYKMATESYSYRTAAGAPLLSTSRETFDSTDNGTLNLLLGVIGAKFNIPGTPLLLTGSILIPLTDAGLKSKVTPTIGVDYSFK